MLYKMSITAMITEDEYNMLVADDSWSYQGNTLVNRNWKKEGIDSVAISRISKGDGMGNGFLYRQLSITFVGFNTENITRKYIDNRIQKTFFQNSYRKQYKLSGFVFRFFIKSNAANEWKKLILKGFNLESRSMERSISPSGKTISYKNEDMEVNIRFAGDYPDTVEADQKVDTRLSDMSDWNIQIRVVMRKGKIHSCIRKYGYKDRSAETMISIWKDLEKRIVSDYLTSITGSGDNYSVEAAKERIEGSRYTRKKKDRLKDIFASIQEYDDIEAFLKAASLGEIEYISNRKSAMDYLRCLDELGINPVAHDFGEEIVIPNITTVLK